MLKEIKSFNTLAIVKACIVLVIGIFITQSAMKVHAEPSAATVSGVITAHDGTPLQNVYVVLEGTNPLKWGCTDSSGFYTITAPNYTGYRINLHASQSSGSANCPQYSPPEGSDAPTDFIVRSQSMSTEVDLPSGDKVKDFSFPTSKLTIIAQDANGNVVTAPRRAYTYQLPFYESAVINGGDSNLYYGTTQVPVSQLDLSGKVSGYVIKGTVFPAGTICVSPLTSTEYCNQSTVTVNDDTTVTIQPITIPSAPSNLTSTSPTKAPNLTWNAVAGATSYNIYANGVLVGTSTTNSYTDNNPTSGNSTYYVTAVNNSGESGHSNSITVTVDITAPVVTNVSQFWNAMKQRTEITLTFSEAVAGLPQGWYGSGVTYTKAFYNTKLAHVTFVDAVGNIGSTTVTPIGPQ